MPRTLLSLWFAPGALCLVAQPAPGAPLAVPVQGWLAPGGVLEPVEGLDGFWKAPGFSLRRGEVVVQDPDPPRLPEDRDVRDRAFAGRAMEALQTWFDTQFPPPAPGEPPARYRLEVRILDVRTVRQGTAGAVLAVYQIPFLNVLLLPSLPAALVALHESVTFEVKVVDQLSGLTQAALHHRSAGTLEWLGISLQGALKSFMAQVGIEQLSRPVSSGPPPWGPVPPFPPQAGDSRIWIHPDLAQRMGPILVRPWPAPAAPDPGSWQMSTAVGWSERMPHLLARALHRHLEPRLGSAEQRPPLVLEGRADLACAHDEPVLDEDGKDTGRRHVRTHRAFQLALKDPATGQVLAAAEENLLPGNPFSGVPRPHRWVRRVAERLADTLPPAAAPAPVPWFPEAAICRKDLPGIDLAWFAPDFSLSGRTLWIQPWEDPVVDPVKRDAKDLASADDFTDLAQAELLGAMAGGLPRDVAVSRHHGDVALRGRLVDASVAGFGRTATLTLFGGAASYLVMELQVVDLRTGGLKAAFRHRIVSMTGTLEPPIYRGPAVGSFLYKFRKFTGALASAMAHPGARRTEGAPEHS